MSENQDNYKVDCNHMSNSDNTGVKQENMDFSALLDKSLQSELDSKLHHSVVGGYSKKSVEDFVAEMRNNLQLVKTQLERQVQDLTAEKASVSQECSVLRTQLQAAEENLEEIRYNVESQQYRRESQFIGEQQMNTDQEENQRLKGMLLDYQEIAEQKKEYEELFAQKEQEVAQLNERLSKYRQTNDELIKRTEYLEKSVNISSLSPAEEIAEFNLQKDEFMAQSQAFSQHMEKTNREFEQKIHHFKEMETQLEKEKRNLADARTQLEWEKQQLIETQEQWAQENQYLAKIRAQIEREQQKLTGAQEQCEEEKKNLTDALARLEQEKQLLTEMQAQWEEEKQNWADTNARLEQEKQQLMEAQEQWGEEKQSWADALAQLEREKQELTETQDQWVQEKQQLIEAQTQLEQEKQNLSDTCGQLEREKQQLMEAHEQLEGDFQKNRLLGQTLEDDQQAARQKEEEIKALMAEKERTIDDLQREQEESITKIGDLETKIETLYLHYSQSEDKIKHQAKIISEKDMLLQHYQQQQQDDILIRQENEKAKTIISSLEKSLEQIMVHMDAQAEAINQYVARSLQERDELKALISERTALQLSNIELIEQQSNLSLKIEELEAKNAQLEEALKQQTSAVLRFDSAKKVVSLNDNNDGNKTEDTMESSLDVSRDAYQKAREILHKVDKYKGSFEDEAADIS